MEHYFINKQHSQEDYFEFTQEFNGKTFSFKSCDSIFSKDRIDYGTGVLLNAVLKKQVSGKVLDIGCGYGAIGIILASFLTDIKVTMTDINETAVELSKHNVIKNHLKNVREIFVSNGYENITESFDYIITNPPIKAGKQNLLNILTGAYAHLNDNGKLYFVIKKKHGEDSIRKTLLTIFSNVEIIKRDSGYYILECVK